MGQIVVGVDGSDGGTQALCVALRESDLRGWPVTAVMMWGFVDQHHADHSTSFDADYSERDAIAALDAFILQAVGMEAAHRIDRHVTIDLAARGLLDASKGAELLVLGARGLGGFRGLLLGSVSQACLHHAQCPVEIVHGGQRAPSPGPERIVVGVDGSAGSDAALEWALDEARARSATVDAVLGWKIPFVSTYPYAIEIDSTPFERAARDLLDAAIDRADTSGLARPVNPVMVPGGGAAAVLAVAEGADLVVAGTRGVGGFTGMLLGSVSHLLAQHAGCPVVIVPS